jgi:hypothetical protein
MTIANMLSITHNAFLSVVVWIALILLALFLARKPFHRAIGALSRIFYNAMRLAARSVMLAEKRLIQRNREVLLGIGLERTERIVEREFDRINVAVARDLESYPHLHRQLAELATRLDEDYQRNAEVPPELPNWLPIIESIANIQHRGDCLVANTLTEINRTMAEQHQSAMESYRTSSSTRHAILNKMRPLWRKVQKSLDDISTFIANLNERAKILDRYMDDYQQIRARTDKAVRELYASSLRQFFISGLLLLVALGGIIMNLTLITLPLSQMIEPSSTIGPYPTSDVFAWVLMLLELTMGLFVMETLRVTRLFPFIGSIDDKMRLRTLWITLAILASLAGLDAALAFLQDRMSQNVDALRQTLSNMPPAPASFNWIPTIGQMILGFLLPFALAFTAIPLESFISAARTVLGSVVAWLLRLLALLLRIVGNVAYYAGRLVVNLFDLAIFPTIWLEEIFLSKKRTSGNLQTVPDEPMTAQAMEDPDSTIEYKDSQD